MAMKNSVDVRINMKNAKIFDLRDSILLNLIRNNEDEDELKVLLCRFSFESVCNNSLFKESLALVNMIRILMRTNNEDLQVNFIIN